MNMNKGSKPTMLEMVLRISVFGTFLGHGIFAYNQNPDWVVFLTFWGISPNHALTCMVLIGIVDILVATIILLKPNRVILYYATFWAFATALMRPLTGTTIWAFVERSANWGAPLALLLWRSAFSSSVPQSPHFSK